MEHDTDPLDAPEPQETLEDIAASGLVRTSFILHALVRVVDVLPMRCTCVRSTLFKLRMSHFPQDSKSIHRVSQGWNRPQRSEEWRRSLL